VNDCRICERIHNVAVPIINLNGTAPEDLELALRGAMRQIHEASEAVILAGPNGRDYQHASGLLALALSQHAQRIDSLERIYRELAEILYHVQTYIDWQEQRNG